jgi:hypothetical protein
MLWKEYCGKTGRCKSAHRRGVRPTRCHPPSPTVRFIASHGTCQPHIPLKPATCHAKKTPCHPPGACTDCRPHVAQSLLVQQCQHIRSAAVPTATHPERTRKSGAEWTMLCRHSQKYTYGQKSRHYHAVPHLMCDTHPNTTAATAHRRPCCYWYVGTTCIVGRTR